MVAATGAAATSSSSLGAGAQRRANPMICAMAAQILAAAYADVEQWPMVFVKVRTSFCVLLLLNCSGVHR